MHIFIIILALIIGPVAVLLYYFWLRDRWEREPVKVLLTLFVGGCISVFPAAIIELVISFKEEIESIGDAFYTSFVVAGFVEELVKFAFVYLLTFRSRYFREEYDGIIYAVTVGLGFAFVENIFYSIQAFSAEGAGFVTVILRAFTAVPSHALDGVILGYFLGRAHFIANAFERRKTMILGIFITILFHGFYDFCAFLMMVLPPNLQVWCTTGLVWVLLVQWGTAHRFIKAAQKRSCEQWGFKLHPTIADLDQNALGVQAGVIPRQVPVVPAVMQQKHVKMVNFCRHCGARVHPHSNFCGSCGGQLR